MTAPGFDYDGSEDEYHYFGEVHVGSRETPEFRAWHAEQERRFGPLVPDEDACDGSENVYYFGARQYVGRLTTPEFRDWLARQERREAADLAAREAAAGGGGAGGESRNRAASSLLPSRWAGGAGGRSLRDGPLPGFARRFRWRASGPPPDLPRKRERRSKSGEAHARNGYSI